MWIPRFGEPFGDTPAECSGCRDKPPTALGSQRWIRIFSSETPNPALQGDSGIWERGGGQVLLWIPLPFVSAAAQGSPGTANPPGGLGTPGTVGAAPQPRVPQGRIRQCGSRLG